MKIRLAALIALLAAATPYLADAAPSVVPLQGYRIRSWLGSEGLRLGNVRQIVQDPDGYLWLASSAGLVRFDGVRFSTTGLVEGGDLPAVQSRTVFIARDGALWVGYASGQGAYQIHDGRVLATYLQDQITGVVSAIAEDSSGGIWLAHDEGLHVIRSGSITPVRLPFSKSDHRVFDVHEDGSGVLWVSAATGLYRRSSGDSFELVSEITDSVFTFSMSEDPTGRMWVTDFAHGFRPADGAADRNVAGRGMNVFFDREGNLWVATFGQGLWKVRRDEASGLMTIARATVDAGLLSDELSGFFEDRDGNLWVGANVGLHRLTPNKAASVGDVGVVYGVATDARGTAWLGGTAGLIALTMPRGGAAAQRRVVSTQEIRALHRSQADVIWAATETGLHQIRDGRLVRAAVHGPQLAHVRAMASDRQARLWVSDDVEGLVSVTEGRAERVRIDDSVSTERPTHVFVDSRDRLWLVASDGSLRMVRNGIVARFGPAEGLPHAEIFAIHDSGDGEMWIGGDQGLSHFVNGRFETLSGSNLPIARVLQIASDDSGDLWLGLPLVGFLRVSPVEIQRALDDTSDQLRYAVYTSSDGIAGEPDAFAGGGTAADREGRLWFVTGRGITVFDPRALAGDRGFDSAPARIEGVTAGNRWYGARAGLTLPPGVTNLRIDYARVNLSSFDRVSFRYRLDGVDTEWVDGTGRRQASYGNLGPGTYRFRVQVTSTGSWDEPETVWAFAIAPAFYQTWWFGGVCLVAVALSVVAFWRLRVRQVKKEFAVVYNERVRLSREIHDTLLQSLAGVAMQLDAASSDPGASSRMQIAMVRMRRQLENYIQETRESIWKLRSGAIDERDLVTVLQSLGRRITSGHAKFTVHVTGRPKLCDSKVRTEVERIAQEALMNAVSHGHAKQITLDVGFSDRTLRLSISDDGQGFDPSTVRRSQGRHYGLIGMQERAAEVGGRCTIESTPGEGAHVVAEFPLSA
jgi:ligand-binding sensor domain-containing protein/signal transduction histidine kinase